MATSTPDEPVHSCMTVSKRIIGPEIFQLARFDRRQTVLGRKEW